MKARAKLLILTGVIAAILYVLISPLPELDATHLLHFPPQALMLLVLLLLLLPSAPRLPGWMRRDAFIADGDSLIAQTCARLC